MFIDDCIEGTLKLFNSHYREPLNIGSDEQVSINQMIKIIEQISEYKVEKKYDLSKPKGVRGRSSDNSLIKNEIKWEPTISLQVGLEKTYKWIYDQIVKNS